VRDMWLTGFAAPMTLPLRGEIFLFLRGG
jgi:hypothetical protein